PSPRPRSRGQGAAGRSPPGSGAWPRARFESRLPTSPAALLARPVPLALLRHHLEGGGVAQAALAGLLHRRLAVLHVGLEPVHAGLGPFDAEAAVGAGGGLDLLKTV